MNKKTSRSTISEDDAFTEITSIQPAADRARFAAINLAGRFSDAKKKSLLRQEKSAVARYGAASPEATRARRRLADEERFKVATQAESERAQVEPVPRNPEAFTLLGRVVDAHRLGRAGLTVSAIDTTGKAVASVVSSKTGYFQLEVPVRNENGTQMVTLLVNDASKNILHRGCECFEARPGAVVTRELVLGSGDPIPQPTPPPEVDPKRVTVPDVRGLTRRQAELQLRALCLQFEVATKETSGEQVGRVLNQKPEPGTTVPLANVVKITVGVAGALVEVPGLVGLVRDEADAALQKVGLQLGSITFQTTPEDKAGKILRQSPEAGTPVEAGSAVDVVIGRAQDLITVPGVVDRSLAQARELLAESKLKVGTIEPANASGESVVLAQSPEAGTRVKAGTAVNLKVRVVDAPPARVQVPELKGTSLAEAEKILKRGDLGVGTISPPDASAGNVVVGQKPAAGAAVPKGTPVDLTVEPPSPSPRRRVAPGAPLTPGKPKLVMRKKTRKSAHGKGDSGASSDTT